MFHALFSPESRSQMDVVFYFYSFSVLQLIKHLYMYYLLCTSQVNFQASYTPASTKLLNLSRFALHFLSFVLTPIRIPYG